MIPPMQWWLVESKDVKTVSRKRKPTSRKKREIWGTQSSGPAFAQFTG